MKRILILFKGFLMGFFLMPLFLILMFCASLPISIFYEKLWIAN